MSWAYRHPVAIVSLFTILVLGGLLSLPLLPVELLPSLAYPTLVVRTTFGDAAPEEVETLITRPVESALGGVTGLRSMTSASTEGISLVTLRFDWGTNMSLAAAEVREKLDTITEQLPRDVKPPLVSHYDPADEPVVTLAVVGDDAPEVLRRRAETVIKPDLETVAGVAAVRISGGSVPEIQVLVDRARLAAHALDLSTVVERIAAANINFPGGKIVTGGMDLPLRTVGRFRDLDQIRRLPVGHSPTAGTVRIEDIAEVKESTAERTSLSRYNGRSSVLLSIIKEPAANIVEVSRKVHEKVEGIQRSLPEGTRVLIADDQGPFIEQALKDLRSDVLWGSALALIVLFVGLRNTSSALLIVVSIPVSIVATMAFMAMGKVSFNFMSIGGLAVGVGMMVDASIVVLESIHRHSLRQRDLLAAVESGVAEVNASVISGTVTTVVVLIPILFMTGLAQRLFRDFAFTLGISLVISLLTALLLLPALVILTRSRGRYGEEGKASLVQSVYARCLGWALDHRTAVVGACLAVLVLSSWGLTRTGFQLLPELDEDQFTMRLILPPDANIQAVETAVDASEALLKDRPEVQAYVTDAGVDPKVELTSVQKVAKPNEARILVTLKPGSYERGDREKVIKALRSSADRVTGARVEFLSSQSFLSRALGTMEGTQLLRLVGDDLTTLGGFADELVMRLTGDEHLKDVTSQGNVWTNQLQVNVDRYQAAARGLSVRDIAQALQTAVEGRIAGKFIREEKETDIRVRLRPEDRTSRDDLNLLPLRLGRRQGAMEQPALARSNPGGEDDDRVALLEQVATLDPGRGPREILRTDRRRNVTINANVVGAAFSKGEEKASAAAAALQLPSGYEVQAGMERLELMSSMASLSLALLVAAMLTYAVMAVQFESVRWPFIIMLVAPMTIAGPTLIFNLLGIPINVLVLIGAVVLIGVVVNNGILLVDYTLTVERSGLPRRDAIIEACRVRLHPILMSTGTTVFGVLPLCFSWGKGAALRTSLALTVNAGLIASLFFTLFLVPVLYSLAAGKSERPVDPANVGK